MNSHQEKPTVCKDDIQIVEALVEVTDRVRASREIRERETIENIEALIAIARHKKSAIDQLVTALKIGNAEKRLRALLQLEDRLLCA